MATGVGAEEHQQGQAALQWHRAGGGQGQPAQGGGVGDLTQGKPWAGKCLWSLHGGREAGLAPEVPVVGDGIVAYGIS